MPDLNEKPRDKIEPFFFLSGTFYFMFFAAIASGFGIEQLGGWFLLILSYIFFMLYLYEKRISEKRQKQINRYKVNEKRKQINREVTEISDKAIDGYWNMVNSKQDREISKGQAKEELIKMVRQKKINDFKDEINF